MIRLAFYIRKKLGNKWEARASDLRSYPGLWWNQIKLRLYEGKEREYSPRTCSIGRPAGDTLRPHQQPYNRSLAPNGRSLGLNVVSLSQYFVHLVDGLGHGVCAFSLFTLKNTKLGEE